MTKYFLLFLLFLGVYSRVVSQNYTSIRFQNLDINNGLSQSSVSCITQDDYGFIWIGTQDGLNRYDGKNFKTFYKNQKDTNTLYSNTINALLFDSSRNFLWIATERGLNVLDYKSYTFKQLFKNTGLLTNIISIVKDRKNTIWINTESNGLFKYENGKISSFVKEKLTHIGLINDSVLIANSEVTGFEINVLTKKIKTNKTYAKVIDIARSIDATYLTYSDKIIEINSSEVRNLNFKFPLLNNKEITKVKSLNNRYILVGTTTNGLFLIDKLKGNISNYKTDEKIRYGLNDNSISEIFIDYAEVVWVGTANNGISLFDIIKQNISNLDAKTNFSKGLSSKIVWAIQGIEDGKILIGTEKGLDCYNLFTNQIINYPIPNKNYKPDVFSISHNEKTLIGTSFGLLEVDFTNNYPTYKNLFDGINNPLLNNILIRNIKRISADEYFLGTSGGLVYFNIKTKKNLVFNTSNSNLTDDNVLSIFKSRDIWWIGTSKGLNKLLSFTEDSAKFKTYLPKNEIGSINGSTILSIEEDYHKNLWIGTFDGGLNKFNPKTEKFKSFTVNDGLSNNAVYGILLIDSTLWMSTNRGISSYHIPSNAFHNYYESDGLQSNEFNVGAYYKSKYDELFFGGINGLSHFYPSNLKKNTIAPKLSFTDILVNNKPLKEIKKYSSSNINELEEIELPYYNNNLTLLFSSLHFTNSGKNNYRFYLEESKDSNILITNDGVANYTSLQPGEYNFVAYSSNSDGIWNEQPLRLKITITPPIWLSWWFKMLVIIFIALIVFSYLWFRVQNIKRQKKILESLVKKRTETIFLQKEQIEIQKAEIEKEKEKADNVLQKIFPDRIAKKLKNKGKIKAEHYKEASILFTDFVQFSKISESLSPEELVGELNRYFKAFDRIIIRNNLFQIKTIGDAYMAVGGIPKNKTNAIDSTLAALQVIEYMRRLQRKDEKTWQLRVGINTGEVVAGVLETKRPLYDVWGSAVNIASRLQDESKPGKVNVSERTYKIIKPYFNCSPRGGILAKNVGVINMYFVDGIKEALSVKGKGILPNYKFHEYLETHKKTTLNYYELETYFLAFLRDNLPKDLYYHSVQHTIDVVQAAENIALNEGITDERVLLIKTAALIHDAGFIKAYDDNEKIGVEYAKEILPNYGYNAAQIDLVCQLILATAINFDPLNKLEKIIKDADLDYLGREDFTPISDALFKELKEKNRVSTKEEWDKKQVAFFGHHKYYTDFSIENRLPKKKTNNPSSNSANTSNE